MPSWSWKAGLASVAIIAASAYAAAQMPTHSELQDRMGSRNSDQPSMSPPSGVPAQMHSHMMEMMRGGMHAGAGQHNTMGMHDGVAGQPTMPGQDAFGAIQEVVQILEAEPSTDWSKVNIDALREHLIDMNEVTLHAAVAERVLDNGVEIAVTGEGRTLEAIKRMVPAHVAELAKLGWNAKTEDFAERSEAYRHHQRPQRTDQAQGARLHGNYGPGWAPSASPFDDREGRVSHALTERLQD